MKINKQGKLYRLWQFLYTKLCCVNDTPHKIALGAGLGTFSGLIPGTGPIFALVLAWIFRANRATALATSLLTNTWLSLLTFVLSIKIGSAIMNLKWQEIYLESLRLAKGLNFKQLLSASAIKVLVPLAVGYATIALCFGVIMYLLSLVTIIIRRKYEDKGRAHLSR